MANVTFHDEPVTLLGTEVRVGDASTRFHSACE